MHTICKICGNTYYRCDYKWKYRQAPAGVDDRIHFNIQLAANAVFKWGRLRDSKTSGGCCHRRTGKFDFTNAAAYSICVRLVRTLDSMETVKLKITKKAISDAGSIM